MASQPRPRNARQLQSFSGINRMVTMELNWLSLLGIALGLAMDAFAVSIAAGLAVASVTPRHVFRIGFHFGLFQFMMPIVGWLAGERLAAYAGHYDHWVAFGLLAYVGGRMLWEARGEEKAAGDRDPTRGLMLVTLSIATSLDALAVGMSMAFMRVSVWIPAVVIGIITAGLSAVGITFGGRIGPRWERWAEAAGGIVLILIGLKVLWLG
jgi:manganese efflux pump family protein